VLSRCLGVQAGVGLVYYMNTIDTQMRRIGAARRRGMLALAAMAAWFICAGIAQAGSLSASNGLAVTSSNQAVVFSPLTFASDDATNQVGILQVTAPAHGTVTISSNTSFLTPELADLFQFAAIQVSNSVVQVNNTNMYPRRTLTNGTWTNSNVSDWIGGFFPGQMWTRPASSWSLIRLSLVSISTMRIR